MEGGADKAYSGNWKTDPHLGIIPRAMEHIFDTLTSEVFSGIGVLAS